MAKKYKVILSVLLVVLIAVAGVVVSGVLDVNRRAENPDAPGPDAPAPQKYTDVFTADTNVALPLLNTTLDGVYYTMTKEGDVAFYALQDGALTRINETGSFEVRAECSSQTLPAVIHYIERDGGYYGCGLFTNLLYPDVLLYDYGFFQVTDMFSGFRGDRLLMIDVDSERFYSNDKIFSEIFTLDDENEAEHFLSENQRTVDINARQKTDFKMFTNDILDQGDRGNVLFFSGRYYVDYAESGKLDIFTSGGSEDNVDNVRYAVDVAAPYFWRTDAGVRFFRTNAEGGFDLRNLTAADADSTVIASFTGSLADDYLIDGHYLLNRKTGEVCDVLTDETVSIPYDAFREGFAPDRFVVSPNGAYCLLRGANVGNVAAIAVADLKTGKVSAFTDEIFGFFASAVVTDDGTAVVSVASGESGTSFYQLVGNFAQAAAPAGTDAEPADTTAEAAE